MATRNDAVEYSAALAEDICSAVAAGGSIAKFCEAKGAPAKRAVFLWLARHKEFATLMAAARVVQADAFGDEIVKIADAGEDAAKVRNQMNARMWVAERANPKRFGAKVELAGELGLNVVVRRFTAPDPAPEVE